MVEPVTLNVPDPENLVIAEDLQYDLIQLTRNLYFQRKRISYLRFADCSHSLVNSAQRNI